MAFTFLPLRRSVPLGAAAYVVGYLVTVAATMGRVGAVLSVKIAPYSDPTAYGDPELAGQPLGELLGAVPSPWVVGGWLFYNAQFVPTSLPAPGGYGGGPAALTNRHLLIAVDGALLALYLLPAVLLVAAGFLVVHAGSTRGVRGDLYAGASVAVGYLPLLVVGAFVLTAPAGQFTASPDGLQTIWVGLVYPAVLGGLGGKLAARRRAAGEHTDGTDDRERRF